MKISAWVLGVLLLTIGFAIPSVAKRRRPWRNMLPGRLT